MRQEVTRALREGYPWGWDHDAGQIPARLAAVTAHYIQLIPTLRAEVDVPVGRIGPRLRTELRIGLDSGALLADDFAGTPLAVGAVPLGSAEDPSGADPAREEGHSGRK